MKTIIKVSLQSLLIIGMLTGIPLSSFAQYIVVPARWVPPDCHSYTGCGVMVVYPPVYYYRPHYHRVYHHSCTRFSPCHPRPVIYTCGPSVCGPDDAYDGYYYPSTPDTWYSYY